MTFCFFLHLNPEEQTKWSSDKQLNSEEDSLDDAWTFPPDAIETDDDFRKAVKEKAVTIIVNIKKRIIAEKLSLEIIENVKERKLALLLASKRTGSSLLADFLSQVPGTFYTFEPSTSSTSEPDFNFTKTIFQCEASDNFWKAAEENSVFHMKRNHWIYSACDKNSRPLCVSREMYQTLCPQFPIGLVKTVRLPYGSKVVTNLLDEFPLLNVVAIFRDPRGIAMSRRNTKDICDEKDCNEVESKTLCRQIEADFEAIERLRKIYGDRRVSLVRYEDLAVSPATTMAKLFENLLGLKVSSKFLSEFIKSNMIIKSKFKKKAVVEGPFGTRRRSATATAFKWVKQIGKSELSRFEASCGRILTKLGYNVKNNFYSLGQILATPI